MCERAECAEKIAQLEAKIEALETSVKGIFCKICPVESKVKSFASAYTMKRHLTEKVS